jgi:hypothetical protein
MGAIKMFTYGNKYRVRDGNGRVIEEMEFSSSFTADVQRVRNDLIETARMTKGGVMEEYDFNTNTWKEFKL